MADSIGLDMRQKGAADVFFLFRETQARREMVGRVIAGQDAGLGREQLFGFDQFQKLGIAVDSNLRLPRKAGVLSGIMGALDRFYVLRAGVGLGDIESLVAHLGLLNKAKVVLATTDNTGLAGVRLREWGLLKVPLVYVSVGLPERMKALALKSPARANRYQKRFACVERLLAYGYEEAEWLRQWLGDSVEVRFIPFGVDVEKWCPVEPSTEVVDVLSIGADSMRDFGLLAKYARQHPNVSVKLVTGLEWVASLGSLPANMRVMSRVPIEELKGLIAGARLVVLPVKENTYSGATTTLLQCMAMGKAVAVSRVGAIREGYGFEAGVNVQWMEPGSAESLTMAVDGLLADSDLRSRLGAAGRQHVVANLGWDRYVAGVESCLADWLAKGEL